MITTNYSHHKNNFDIMSGGLDKLFTYHAPQGDQTERYTVIRDNARQLAALIIQYCPPSADTTAAIRLLREAVMTANASIAIGEAQTK